MQKAEAMPAVATGPEIEIDGMRYALCSPAVADVATGMLRTNWLNQAHTFTEFAPIQPEIMDQGQCYRNARILAQSDPGELYFFEGLFGKILECEPGTIAVCGHAWCVDREGRIVEPSVQAGEARFYFGVPVAQRDLPCIETRPFAVDDQVLRNRWAAFEEWIAWPAQIERARNAA